MLTFGFMYWLCNTKQGKIPFWETTEFNYNSMNFGINLAVFGKKKKKAVFAFDCILIES